MKEFLKRLFWISSRVGRLEYVLVAIFAWNICGSWLVLAFPLAPQTGGVSEDIVQVAQSFTTPFAPVWAISALVGLWISVANNFKRLHDLGWSGLWQFVPPVAVFGWARFAISIDGHAGHFQDYHPGYLIAILVFGIGGWIAIVSGCFALLGFMFLRRGEDGDNAYGPPPNWPSTKAPAITAETAEGAAAP